MPLAGHPGHQLLLDRLDPLDAALGAHRPAQQVGLVAVAVAEHPRHVHQLLLEQRHAQGALQHRDQQRVGVARPARDRSPGVRRDAPRRPGSAPAGSARSRSPGRRTRAAAAGAGCRSGRGSRPGTRRPSRPGRACRRPPAPPWGWCSSSQCSPRCSRDDPHHVVERAEHPEPEQVELHQPHELAAVLVPLQDGALLHPGPLDRHHLADRPLGEHHPAGVDPEVPRGAEEPVGEVDDRRRVRRARRRRRARRPSSSW